MASRSRGCGSCSTAGIAPSSTRSRQTLDIRLGQRVTSIEVTDAAVEVTTDGGRLSADRAIVTLPLGVLKAGDVTFRPALPGAVADAIGRLGMGSFLKVALRFPERDFPGGADWLGRVGEPTFREWIDLQPVTDEPIVVGFATGSEARRLEGLDDDTVVAEALTAYRAVVAESTERPSAAVVTRWGMDPLARGAYSFLAARVVAGGQGRTRRATRPSPHAGRRGDQRALPIDGPRSVVVGDRRG